MYTIRYKYYTNIETVPDHFPNAVEGYAQ